MLAIVTTKIIAFSGMIQRNFPEPDLNEAAAAADAAR